MCDAQHSKGRRLECRSVGLHYGKTAPCRRVGGDGAGLRAGWESSAQRRGLDQLECQEGKKHRPGGGGRYTGMTGGGSVLGKGLGMWSGRQKTLGQG